MQRLKLCRVPEDVIPDIAAALKDVGQQRPFKQRAAAAVAADKDDLRFFPAQRVRLPVETAQRVFPLKEMQVPGNVLRVCIGHAVDREAGLCRLQSL